MTQGVAVLVAEEVPHGHGFDLEGLRQQVEVLFASQGVKPNWDDVNIVELKPVWRKGETYTPLSDSVIVKNGEPRGHISAALNMKQMAGG